jgi:soluble P-type ATPase
MSKYGGINNELLAKKFEVTDMVFNDMNTINDFNRDILKDIGPDKATLASDAKRTNKFSETRINLREKGTRWKNEPIHHDINLSFTDKDPRGTNDGPDLRKLAENAWSRKDDYKHSFKKDADHSVPSAGVSEPQVALNKRKARERVSKMYYKDFGTSKDGWTSGYNQRTSIRSKAGMVEHTNQLMNINDALNMEKRRDITTTLSNILPIGHLTTTDNMFNVADYSILYNKPSIDTYDYIKNNYKSELSGNVVGQAMENKLAKQLELFVEDIQQKKETMMNKDQEIKYGDENGVFNKDLSQHKEFYTQDTLRKGERSEKKRQLVEELLKNNKKCVSVYNKHNDFNKTDMELPDTVKKSNELISQVKKLASRERNLKSAMTDIIESHNKEKINLCNNKTSLSYKRNHHISNKSKTSEDTVVDFNSIQRNNIDSIFSTNYKTNLNESKQNKTKEYKKDFDTYALTNNNTDVLTNVYKTNLSLPDIASKDNVRLETEFGENKYLNRNTGKMGTKYLFNEHSDDHDISEINEKISMKTHRKTNVTNKPIFGYTTQEQPLTN